MLFHVNPILANFYWQCTNCTAKTYVTLIGATLILANKITITTFSLAGYVPVGYVTVKYGINFTADKGIFVWAFDMGIFEWAFEWVWY